MESTALRGDAAKHAGRLSGGVTGGAAALQIPPAEQAVLAARAAAAQTGDTAPSTASTGPALPAPPAPLRRQRRAAQAGQTAQTGDAGAPAARSGARVAERRVGSYRRVIKRGLDLLAVLATAPVTALLVGMLALIVARDGGSPFYCQDRVGRGGRPYRMWKLRTMVHDADARLEAHLRANPVARAEWNSKQKLLDDPRITTVGRLLRKTSLDELPQLWNVVCGDMSLVGPRPMMPSQQRLYPGRDYYHLRPGITGLWQISDRNAATFADRAKFDAVYNRTVSLGLDIGILASTLRVVLRGTGH